jgi:methylmalonyl-CoA/ethylmalonyl-CoA epimerase
VPATRVHHVNFIVRDLESACRNFEQRLGIAPFETVDHAPRGAHVARSKVGETWLVLVCPYDADSVPGRFLAKHGEGFFLLSLGTTDLAGELGRLTASGVETAGVIRDGILDWCVADVGELNGALFQLTEDT